MPFTGSAGDKNFVRTNGSWSGPTTWQQTEAGGHSILSLDEDVHDQDMAVAIDNSLQRNGDNKATGDIPMNGYKFTGLGPGVNNGDIVQYEQLMQSQPLNMAAGQIVATASANALTIAIKRLDGTDPTLASPVFLQFHSYAAGNGLPQVLKVTSPLSLVLSAGSTMGAAANVPIKIFILSIADGTTDGTGTLRLGAINTPQAMTNFGSYMQFTNSVAEGGAGAADSANTVYAAAGVTFKPYRIIGYLFWPNGLPVAGNWAVPPYIVTQSLIEPVPLISATPIGAVMPYAGAAVPFGWMLCNGQAISRTTYANLYSVLGNFYGAGDGSTTFNVPDLMGRVVAHYDPGMGRLTASGLPNGMNGGALGNVGGHQYHVLAAAELAAHQHYMDHTHVASGGGQIRTNAGGTTTVTVTAGGTNNGADPTTSAASTPYTSNPPAYGSAHNNQPPTFVLYYLIFAGA